MLLQPKKIKYSKSFSGKKILTNKCNMFRYNKFSNISLIAVESGRITNFQIEAIKRFLKRFLKKKAQIFFRVFPSTPITKKPNDVRLGRGKGNIKYWSSVINKNTIFLEVRSYDNTLITKILKKAQKKLPIKTFLFDKRHR